MRQTTLIGMIGMALAGCDAPPDTDAASSGAEATSAPDEDVVSPELRQRITAEALRLGEEMYPGHGSTSGAVCAANCAAGYAALCYAVTRYCATATVITLGGASVPCATAMTAACIGGAGLSALCGRSCGP